MGGDDDFSTGDASIGLSATSSAAWNPALRPNGHTRNISTASNDDFFDRYPAPTPEKPPPLAHESGAEEAEDVEVRSPTRSRGLAIDHDISADPDPAQTGLHSAHPEIQFDLESPASPPWSIEDENGPVFTSNRDLETALFQPEENVQKRSFHLQTQLSVPDPEAVFIGSPGLDTPTDLEKELAAQGATYEHQSETLDMEAAVDEKPSAPLLDDEEPPPTVDIAQREATMRSFSGETVPGLDDEVRAGQPLPQSSPQPGHIERSFTTNFTELPTPDEPEFRNLDEPRVPISTDWPAAGDDKTFGELLGDDNDFSSQGQETIQQEANADDGWGEAVGNDAFGELLDSKPPQDQAVPIPVGPPEELATLDAPVTAPESKEEDLAAMWQAALDDDDLLEESNDLDPSKFFGDDDPGFLEDEISEPANTPVSQSQRAASSYVPTNGVQPARSSAYAASRPQMLGQAHARSAGTPSTGLLDVYGHNAVSQPAQQPHRPGVQSAQSFVDKAKGGYQSPYDLPMDVVRPKQRSRPAPTVSQVGAIRTPPPRTSSMSQPSQSFQASSDATGANLTPPASRAGPLPSAPLMSQVQDVASAKATPKTNSGFFEDLPVAPKARSRPSGAYTPQIPSTPTTQLPSQSAMRESPAATPRLPVAPTQQQLSNLAGLTRHTERLPLLPDPPTAPVPQSHPADPQPSQRYSPSSLPTPAAPAQSRFSPAPSVQGPPAPTASRYSPAPTAQGAQGKKYSISGPVASAPPGIHHAHPFAPRTSSPLASQTDKAQAALLESPSKTNGYRSPGTISPERSMSINYSPIGQRTPGSAALTSPPQIPLTQSPPAVMKTSRYATSQPDSIVSTSNAPTRSSHLPHRRQFSMDLAFAPPNDERVHDSLERWKGHPVFKWGDSGSILSSFPKHTPFYGAGGSPTLRCTPGVVNVSQASSFMPMDDRNAKFPGPLTARAKGRKKEVLGWMSGKIEDLEKQAEVVRMDFQVELDLKKRIDEKVVLWKLMRIYVEHDGRLEGDAKIEEEVRQVLLPNLVQMGQVTELQSPISTGASLQADSIDKSVVLQLRQALLQGQREKAVWLAEENKLWGHAMLIASTLGPDVWKQIVQSFVRSQVKTIGSDARSLAALYQVFAGNSEECVDELVPPSARAGFQMISKSDGAIARDPLEGLDQWRETLGLVAGNRTPADGPSLVSLGKLLGDYGRAEASHSCFLFARQLAKHTGADDTDVSFVLLGADHKTKTESFANNLDAILLTEIYEWASSLSAPSAAVQYIPHLQSFKLIHAQGLAASGLKSKAQSYCDHITSAYTSTTRPSPYYHPTFTQAVNDLSAFLSQTPQSGEGGRLSKLAMNKVSSGAASWFTKFVSGDDDQESNHSGQGAGSDDMMSGPFGRVNGDSPDLSRNPSTTNLYTPAMGSGAPYGGGQAFGSTPPQSFAPSSAPSKYASVAGASKYAPMVPGVMNATSQRPESPRRPASTSNYAPASTSHSLGVTRPDAPRSVSEYVMPHGSDSRRNSAQFPGSQDSYEPQPTLAEETPMYGYQPVVSEQLGQQAEKQDSRGENMPGQSISHADNDEYRPSSGGYQPPSVSYGGYEPPSYQPYEPEPEAEEEASKPRRGIMDDDDDDGLGKRAAAMKKAAADREADDAFKKAAEADAERDKAKAAGGKKGWLGGWFGGKKESQDMPTVHKAKLGEENSFFYDENLKKWVNRKGGSEAAAPAAAAPPPPRGPSSRGPSGIGPPSGPPSRNTSMSGLPQMAGPPPGGARPPPSMAGTPSAGPPSVPSSRSGTPAFGDGPPMPAAVTALNGGGPPSRPPSRPSTSMSNASSLDDLLGGPPGPGQRKAGGTAKSKKKGGRYVDVMQSK